jgi:lipoprotein-releasing system permease protein
MSFEFFIAQRYLWSRRRHPFVGVISVISILGICVGVAALITVLAVMNGFDEDLKDRIIGMRAHIVIEKEGPLNEWRALMPQLDKLSEVKGTAPYIEAQALIQNGEWASGVLVRGVDTEREKNLSKFHDYVVQGELSGKPNGVVVGSELAKRLGLTIGSKFFIITQTTDKPTSYVVEGFFASGMFEYDANLIFLTIPNAQKLFEMKDGVTGISIYLKDSEKAAAVKKGLQQKLKYPFFVRTWMDMNKTLFGALKLEKLVMFLILALIILVACLNIAGSLTIMVMDKTKDIGVLKSLGASPASLMKIFALDGFIIGTVGALTGLAIGLGLCFVLKTHSFIDLPKEIYYIDRLPVHVDVLDTARVVLVAILLSFISAIYPAIVAGRLNPVKALRYE